MWRKKLKNEIGKCILINEKERKFWLEKADALPETLLRHLYEIIHGENLLAERYIRIAIKDDPKLLIELGKKIKNVKRKTLILEESSESSTKEAELEKLISKL
jgi:hypothetical protein